MEKVNVKMYWSEGSIPVIYPNSQPGSWNEDSEEYVLDYPDKDVSLFSSELYSGSLGGYKNARLNLVCLYRAFLTGVFEGDAYYFLIKREAKFYPLPLYWGELSDKEKESIINALEIALSFDDEALHEFLEKN